MNTNKVNIDKLIKKINIGSRIGFFSFIILSIFMIFDGIRFIDNLSWNLVELIIASFTILFRTFLISVLGKSFIVLDQEKLENKDNLLLIVSIFTHYILTKVIITSTLFVILEKYAIANNIKILQDISLLTNYKDSLFIDSAVLILFITMISVVSIYLITISRYKLNKPVNYDKSAIDILKVFNSDQKNIQEDNKSFETIKYKNISNDGNHKDINNKILNNSLNIQNDARDFNKLNNYNYNNDDDIIKDEFTIKDNYNEEDNSLEESILNSFKQNTGRQKR